ncbi:MAG: hypothetical protein CM1200mP40_17150 [Gammaproteobacteria bacterium]|nr:MAG: hypothetical protein CM1200mP40_17150 [Gammaproteobacteria bacterium]
MAVAKIRKAVISVFLYERRSTRAVSYLQWNQRARNAQVLTRFHSGILQVLQKEFLLLVYRIGGPHLVFHPRMHALADFPQRRITLNKVLGKKVSANYAAYG